MRHDDFDDRYLAIAVKRIQQAISFILASRSRQCAFRYCDERRKMVVQVDGDLLEIPRHKPPASLIL